MYRRKIDARRSIGGELIMVFETVDLYKYFGVERAEGAQGYLDCYIPEISEEVAPRVRPAMLVIGGGGYGYVSSREKECIAFAFLAQSFASFVLRYSVAPVRYPAQLIEADMAVIYIRENAEKFGIDKDHVAAIGFSAGGHLTGMLGIIPDEKEAKEILGEKIALARPNAVVLSYPVISGGEMAHRGSFENLCGDNTELFERLSLEKRVDANSAPAFIWTTANDGSVPSENSLYVAAAYKKAGVPFELHVFEDGQHGLSLATEETQFVSAAVSRWVELCGTWLKVRGFAIKYIG